VARIQITVLFVLSMFPSVGAISQASAQSFACPVTKPNGKIAPGQTQETMGGQWYGNGDMWTLLWPDGTVKLVSPGGPGEVLEDGSLSMKFPWWLGPRAEGKLTITGKRLDASAPPLRARIPDGYGPHFQATGLVFPTEGCWEVTGRAGHASLTFVTRAVKIQATQQR
jgi:hypothetical protein